MIARARSNGQNDFERMLEANEKRIGILSRFTGGNPRLVLMLYSVISQSGIVEVSRSLDRLLDLVTPYFKARIEDLPPQQRKVLISIAETGAKTNQGVSPGEVARQCRLTASAVSVQLKRLSEAGFVSRVDLRGRTAYYVLSEQLLSVWYSMRYVGTREGQGNYFVSFLLGWYDPQDLADVGNTMREEFRKLCAEGSLGTALEAAGLITSICDAVPDREERATLTLSAFEDIVCAATGPLGRGETYSHVIARY